jgi:methionine-rich copper-binding protein CopC
VSRARGLAALLAALLAVPGVAVSHPALVTSSPRSGEAVSTPKQLVLRFNEPIEAAFTHVELVNAANVRQDVNGVQSIAEQPNAVVLTLPTLAPGEYSTRWSAVGRDGHRVKGEFRFTVK